MVRARSSRRMWASRRDIPWSLGNYPTSRYESWAPPFQLFGLLSSGQIRLNIGHRTLAVLINSSDQSCRLASNSFYDRLDASCYCRARAKLFSFLTRIVSTTLAVRATELGRHNNAVQHTSIRTLALSSLAGKLVRPILSTFNHLHNSVFIMQPSTFTFVLLTFFDFFSVHFVKPEPK